MPVSATVRMYNQENLGDCFLLKFQEDAKEIFILVDFGSYEGINEVREKEIAESIKETVKGNPLIIVLTHQHKDHLSGFSTAQEVLSSLEVSQLWLSFLDDPNSEEGKAIKDLTIKFWNKNKENKRLLGLKFGEHEGVKKMLQQKEALNLFAEEQVHGAAIKSLLELSKNNKRFLLPGESFIIPGLSDNSVRVYVLGPPIDKSLLTKLRPGKDEEVNGLNAAMELMNVDTSASLMLEALNALPLGNEQNSSYKAEHFPFNKKFASNLVDNKMSNPLEEAYKNVDTWRKIDHEWLSEMGRLSLHMDTLTNNTSLVLAFELVQSGKVLLFVGDAQIGSWKSWANVKFDNTKVNAKNLLSRTVLYKCGHHSSHNATLKESLDLMNEEELVIMIPVNEKVSTNRKFAMLRSGMLMGCNRKSQGRVLRSDTIFHNPGSENCFKYPFYKSETDFGGKLKIIPDKIGSHLAIEYTID